MSISDRLGRLLFIVPYVNHRDGVPLAELADTLGVTPQQIEADLDLLSMVGQPPLTPDHLIDLYVEDEVVYVELDQSLSRPLRLTHDEARAIVLGAKLVGNLGGLGDELERVLNKIMAVLNPVDREAVQTLSQRIAVQAEPIEPDARAVALRTAIDAKQLVQVQYYSASSDREKHYRLKPLVLLTHSGVDYLVALDVEAEDQEKLFRMDRVGAVQQTSELFEPPAFNVEKFRTQRLYFGTDHLTAAVRFPAHLASQLRERFAEHDLLILTDGSLEVRVSTSSVAWLTRWVLQFAQQAEVVGPPEICHTLRDLCYEAAVAYKQPVDAAYSLPADSANCAGQSAPPAGGMLPFNAAEIQSAMGPSR